MEPGAEAAGELVEALEMVAEAMVDMQVVAEGQDHPEVDGVEVAARVLEEVEGPAAVELMVAAGGRTRWG